MPLSGEERQQLLLMERDGTLPEEMKGVVDGLRKAGQLNPALPSKREAGADVMLDVRGTRPAEAAPVPTEVTPEQPSLASRVATGVGRAAGQAVLPTVGGLVGAAAGGLITSPTVMGVPAGVIGGEMVGSAAGEKLNQMLGITEPSNAQVALAAAGGPAGRLIGGAARGATNYLLKRAPGAAGGLSEIGAEAASNIPAIIRPKVSVDDLYAQVEKFNPPITMGHLRGAIAKLQGKEGQVAEGLQSTEIKSITAGLEKMAGGAGGDVPFQQVRANLRRLGDVVERTRAQGGEVNGAAKLLKGAIEKDLEVASGNSAIGDTARVALKTANAAARKNFAANDLAEVIEKQGLTTVQSGDGMLVRVHPAKIANFIRKDEYFRKSVEPGELDQIHTVLRELAKIPAPPAPRGVATGTSLAFTRTAAGGGVAGMLSGGDPVMTSAGAAISAYAPVIISKMMMSDKGRRMLVSSLKSNRGFLDHKVLAAGAQLIRTEGTAVRDALRNDEP